MFPETTEAGDRLMEQYAVFALRSMNKCNSWGRYKSSALGSSIQLMRIERNHAPHGRGDGCCL